MGEHEHLGFPPEFIEDLDRIWARTNSGGAVFVCIPDRLMKLFSIRDLARVLSAVYDMHGETLRHAVNEVHRIIRRDTKPPPREPSNWIHAWRDD